MNYILKNEKVKYALMAIGAVTVLTGLVIAANAFLTSKQFSVSALDESSDFAYYAEDGELRKLVKEQVLDSIDEGGYLNQEDLKTLISDEMLNDITSDVKEKVDTAIANEVDSATGKTLSESQIKAIVGREVANYMKNNSSDLSEITKLKEQIESLKKADTNLSSKISSVTGKTGAAGKNGVNGVNGVDGKDGKDGTSSFTFYSVTGSSSDATLTPSKETRYMQVVQATSQSEAKSVLSSSGWVEFKFSNLEASYDESSNTVTFISN